MLTINEKKVLKILTFSFGEDYSINEISRKCNIAPNGAFKILKKFEREGILIVKKISNIKAYKIDLENNKAKNVIELTLIEEFKGKIKSRYLDLLSLKEIVECCILFGSYINKENPNDLDMIFVVRKDNYKRYKELSNKIFPPMPIKVHDVVQTNEDFISNIKRKDPVIIESLRKGIILWGHKIIIEAIENANER